MMIDIGIIGCIGLAITDWIINHHEAIKFYCKDILSFYFNKDKEIFNK